MKHFMKKPDTFLNILNEDISQILHRNFDNIFPEHFLEQEVEGLAMPVDLKEYEDAYDLKVEIPGIKKDDIYIDINKSSIKIDAHKECEKEETDKKKKCHKTEFKYGHYSRTLYFPHDVSVKNAKADLKDGILKVYLPKIESHENPTTKLEIN